MTQLLAGRVALVTGSSRGIGRATAIALAEAGADVIVHHRRNLARAEETASEVERSGRAALVVQADLGQSEDVSRVFGEVERWRARLDIFVANAAATAFKPALALKEHHIERTYNLIVRSYVQAAQQAVPLMEAGGHGRIIAITGHGTDFTLPNYSLLGSAKAAMESFTRYLAKELGPLSITVNCLSPGVVPTDSSAFYSQDRYDSFLRAVTQATPLGRTQRPEDVAGTVVLLASDLAGFITGQVIRVDGGFTLTSGPFQGVR